ncbi:MAG: ATP-dependent metallopeptidase FtsH/Yme1/Tma family protein, partial [Trichococcus flocculiformis]
MADDKNKNNRKWNVNLNNENPDNRKRTAYYLLMALSVLMFLNYFALPSYLNRSVEEVTYSTFLNQVSTGDVSEVKLEENQITFVATDDAGDKQVYITGLIDDPTLVTRLEEADVTFSKDIPTEASPILSILVSWVLPLLLFWGLGSMLGKQMAKRMGGGAGGALSFGKSNAKVYVKADDAKTFKDVAGQDEAKEALSEVVDYLHQPKKYQDIGAKNPKGILLVGPPGTGKTLLARAVAGEADVPFFSISGSEFVEMFVGRGAAKVRDLFKEANEKAPCIVFIVEIDTIGKKRDNGNFGGGNDEREQTLNQLLAEMDGFEANKGIILLAATNRPESLDAALLRPGRFDRRVPVELPDLAGREAILKVHAKNYKMDPNIDYNT